MRGGGDPNLRFHRVLVHAEKGLDTQMLFDPFEKEFDLPTAFIKLCNGQRVNFKVVGKKAKTLFCFLVIENDIAHILRIILLRSHTSEPNRLITTQSSCFINGA